MHPNQSIPDLDAIACNLIALDLAYIGPQESSCWEAELSALVGLNEVIEVCAEACRSPEVAEFWQRVHITLSDTAALLSSRLALLIDLNGERADQQLSLTLVGDPASMTTELAESA
ncbi:MAG: hypothetical protein AAF921_17945 [Cyanobacteria bacterium P01_D01_bin.44]